MDAVGEPGQARAAAVGPADAVVTHRQIEGMPAVPDRDFYGGGLRVLGRIRQRLGDDVIRADLNPVWQPTRYPGMQRHRYG
jgi:hypothetical protein